MKNLKVKLVIFILLIMNISLFSEGYFGLNYTKIQKLNHCVSVNGASFTNNKYFCFETPLFFVSWINKDQYNSNKTNYSISTIPHSLATYLYLSQTLMKNNSIAPNQSNILLLPICLANSKIEFSPSKFKTNSGRHLSPLIFVKNNFDVFLFEKNNWFRYTPGIGVGIKFISLEDSESGSLVISTNIGIQKIIEYKFKTQQFNTDTGLFFSITISAQV